MTDHTRTVIAIRITKTAVWVTIGLIKLEHWARRTAETCRHPVWWARYARARLLHPQPGLPDDGDALSFEETRALAGIITGHKRTAAQMEAEIDHLGRHLGLSDGGEV